MIIIGEELIASLKLDKQQFNDDAKEVKTQAENTSKDVDQMNKEAEKQTDLTFLKAVQTVQHATRLLNQVLRLSGHTLGVVGQSVIDIVTTTAATLIPLLTAQSLTGWQTVQAITGLANVTLSLLALPDLISAQISAGNMEDMWIQDSNTGIGRLNTQI